LSDAEAMKERIKQPKSSSMSPSNNKSPASSPTNKGSVFQSLSAALGGKRVVKRTSNSDIALSSSSSSSSPKQSTGQSTASFPKKSITNATQRQSSQRQSSPPSSSSPSNQQQQQSPFFKSNDPLVQTIKSDLYVNPSQLQDISWDDIAGLADAKQSLQEAAILPLMRPDLFTGLRKPRNILLYGPPGTGKTMLVRAVAKESQCLLFLCTASALTSKWHGEGEKLVRTLFEVARAAAPSIIFVDEMDALLSARKSDGEHEASRRFKTEFMTQLDGIVKGGGDANNNNNNPQKHLLVVACTNTPWDIDSAVLRRFPRRIFVPLPDSTTRKALLKKLLDKAGKHNLSSADCKTLVKRTEGFSGSDIASIASEASFGPLRSIGSMDAIRGVKAKDIRPISLKDFETAIAQSTKSVSLALLQHYDDWKQQQSA
jgi:SpoVK/Ycf46/Vps4 family AAA+-type ATPase